MGGITEADVMLAQQALGLLELTSVNGDDTSERIVALCQRAMTPVGQVAAVCVAARYAGLARRTLDQLQAPEVKVVAAINFPGGSLGIAAIERRAHHALQSGADELELVYPYHALLAGDRQIGPELIAACQAQCASRTALTVTLETGVLRDPQIIREVCREAIFAGASFLKTSTGKAIVNATPQATRIMLEAIAETGGQLGLKVVGGFRTVGEARVYMQMAAARLSPHWLQPERMRLGTTSLLDELLEQLSL
jgi:deoxyribose-phosphate aldolase